MSESEGWLRPADTIEPHEWVRYWKAKQITDVRALAGLVPACNQAWKPPMKHEKGEFTFAELRHVPGAPPRLPKLETTKRRDVARKFPNGWELSSAEYVQSFIDLNNLKG